MGDYMVTVIVHVELVVPAVEHSVEPAGMVVWWYY